VPHIWATQKGPQEGVASLITGVGEAGGGFFAEMRGKGL